MKVIYKHGSRKKKDIALTFDDGPEVHWTEKILDILTKYEIQATFFVSGKQVEKYPELVSLISKRGHEIGNHGYSHMSLRFAASVKIENQIIQTDKLLERYRLRNDLYRPAYQRWNPIMFAVLKKMHKKMILADVVPKDFKATESKIVTKDILKNTRNGSIIILHDGGGDRRVTVESLEQVIPQLKASGFKFKTISQLLF